MASIYMPSVVVEIAFNAGYSTPAASRTWTDVTDFVELHNGIDIDFGRQDERSTADANQLTLTLDNKDGRFTALRAASPYYPNVKIGRPIRVRATPPGGTVSTRFTGFIDEWPVEWDGSDAYAKATIRASSRLSRLGLTAGLKSMPEQEVLSGLPFYYWTLGDPSDAISAAESSGRGGVSLTRNDPIIGAPGTPVVFGQATGPYTDGLTAATFGGLPDSQRLYGYSGLPSGSRTYRASFRLTALPPFGFAFVVGDDTLYLRVDGTGLLRGPATIGPSINDGGTHDIAIVRNGVNEILYLDGAVVATAAAAAPAASTYVAVGAGSGTPGVVAHVAAYDRALATAEISGQATAMRVGFAGDRTDQRVLRLLSWAGIAATEVAVDIGSETMTYQQTSGQSVVDALREAESTEGGVLFDGTDGNVQFHARHRRYLATPAVTLNMASQHVGSDYAPRLDRSALVNEMTVENPTTGESARLVDTTSRDEYGVHASSSTSVLDSIPPLEQRASWAIASYGNPRIRVPSLTVDVLAHQGSVPSAQTLLATTVSDVLAITNAPTQSDTTTPSYFVEGYTERIGVESYEITFNLSPTYPTLNTFVLDSATRGVLDTNVLAY